MALQVGYYVLCLLGILKKRSKALALMMIIIMWIVYGLSTYNGDFGVYSWIYQNIQNPAYWAEFELLYNVFMYICSILGLSFIQFRMVFGAAFVILLYYTIGKYTINIAEALGLYMLFPFLTFTSIVRSGFAGVLIVLAYHEVIAGENNRIKFWLLMITAILFQYTSILFLFFYFLRNKTIKPYTAVLVIFLIFFIFVSFYSSTLYHIVSLVTSNQRTLKWFAPGLVKQKFKWGVYLVIIELMVLLLAYLSRNRNRIAECRLAAANPYAEDVFHFCISMLFFIPVFFVTSNASARLIWQILLLIIISYAKDDECSFYSTKWTKLQFSKETALLIIFLLAFSYYANLPYRGTPNDGKLVFQNNLVYGEYVNPSGRK